MKNNFMIVGLVLCLTFSSFAYASTSGYAYAVVESCSGCSLNRLTDVKEFIFGDVPNYDRVQFKSIRGAPPELVLYDEFDQEVERLQLSKLTRQECNDLLVEKGFNKNARSNKDEF